MKTESRFLIVFFSLLLGILGGWFYFEAGDLFCGTRPKNKAEKDFLSFLQNEEPETPQKDDSSEVIAQMRSNVNETLYQHTARLEAEKAKKKAETTVKAEEPVLAATSVPPSGEGSGGSSETVSQNVLSEMAGVSAPLAESLKALAVLREQPASSFHQSPSSTQVAGSTSRPAGSNALFQVKDFVPQAKGQTPSLELSIASKQDSGSSSDDSVDFQVESPLEAQKALSAELASQAPASVKPLVQTPAPAATGDLLQPAAINQALGSRMELPSPPTQAEQPASAEINTVKQTSAQVPAWAEGLTEVHSGNGDDLDENPLATIMGLKPQEKAPGSEVGGKSKESTGLTGTESETNNQVASYEETSANPNEETAIEKNGSGKSQPTRMKKPVRTAEAEGKTTNEVPESPAPEKEFKLDLYRVDLRKALASFQIETGLKVVASLDVQGTVSCRSQNRDPEVLLGSLLADTSFRFVRSGKFVYIAHSDRLENLPTPLEKTDSEIFVPKNISVEELEIIFRSNLSQFGKCERTRDESGQEGLRVTDWVLSLEQLEDVQQIVDLPAPENRINAFVFQRELDGTFKSLELVAMAEERGLVLQRMTIPNPANPQDDKKPVFMGGFSGKNKEKKERPEDIKVYSISYRADALLVSLKDQLRTAPAPMPGQTSAPMQLGQQNNFDFNLNVQNQIVPYRFTITFRQNNESGQEGFEEILADVVCAPREDLGPKAKPKPIQFTLPIPARNQNSLICQFNLGEFPVESTDKRKNPAYAIHGNRMTKEAIIVICPYQQVAKLPKTGLSTQAIREIIRQQEVFGRKFYGSLNRDERAKSAVCFGIAKRLRMGLGETAESSTHVESED